MTRQETLKKVLSSPILWIQNFVKIPNKQGKLIPFKLNELQKEFIKNWDKYNVILKSRQLGFSTLSCGLSLYYACTQPNSDILMVSYSIDSATAIFDRLKIMYNTIPSAIKPTLHNNNKKELKFSNGSRIICATAGNKELARGMTIKFCHLSEYGFWKENAPKHLLAIEQALSGKLVIESTANGLNHFNELWTKAENGENLYKPFFFNWYQNKSMFQKDYDFAVALWKDRNNGKLLTVDELDQEERLLYDNGATIPQLIWRRLKISNSSEEQFKQEFPATPLEAFVTTGNSIFDNQFIAERSRYLPNHISRPNDLPNVLKGYYGTSFKIWIPKTKGKYYIGVDCSEGLKQDYSVVEILNAEGEQVAEFRSNTIKPYKFAEVVNALGKYYNNAYLVVEKASSGHTVLDRLRHDYKYLNMHKHKEYDARGKKKKKIGFLTNEKSKSMIINDLVECVETRQILINSKNVLEEMKVFVMNKGKMGAMQGRHDDTIMALAMALHGVKTGKWYI